MERTRRFSSFAAPLVAVIVLIGAGAAAADTEDDFAFSQLLSHSKKEIKFDLVRSKGIQASGCLPNAAGHVKINSIGPVEIMTVELEGLPPRTAFDVFVIQVPNAPFGLSWYQGDMETDAFGRAHQRFMGRFNTETFVVGPGSAPAPVVHSGPFPDASLNPPTNPVHTFHLGIWFNSSGDAKANFCPDAVTPFNGEHNAGIQVLNTGNFADEQGPLRQLSP